MIHSGVSSLGSSGVLEWPAPYLGGSGRALGSGEHHDAGHAPIVGVFAAGDR